MTGPAQRWPGVTPPLGERCWFPVPAREAIAYPLSRPGQDQPLYGYAHAHRACTSQQPETDHPWNAPAAGEITGRTLRDETEL